MKPTNLTKIKLIAEIGWNHMGDMRLAKKMVLAAKKSGADFVKFQAWSVNNLQPGPWDTDGRREIYEKAELSKENFILLQNYCKKIKVKMTTSIFNIKDFYKIEKCKFDYIKIPSHEVYNSELIRFCENNYKNLLISVGAAKWNEILNLKKIKNFKKKLLNALCFFLSMS